jgi:hypothetical protein
MVHVVQKFECWDTHTFTSGLISIILGLSEVSYSEVLADKGVMYIRVTLY